ncbi:flagellar hook-basal body complex protein FliE [Chungangia koreensis]|uniref:Flagellar hook-basal body complex protein FliE n=1 Tax=Chungangia koreensis TaxID=752657 RepID=A0ABV8X113_9LACT
MAIQSVSLMGPGLAAQPQSARVTPFEAQQNFGTMLKDAIQSVNDQQAVSDKLTGKLIRGEEVELHQVMIASQKASITLNATMEIRNKVIEAYQEVMRMPV